VSDDPETRRQIAALAADDRPLLVVDVDEVVLEFVNPFMGFLADRDLALLTGTFRLHGNVVHKGSGAEVAGDEVSRLMTEFFEAQENWQRLVQGADSALADIAAEAHVVLLSAMPHAHRAPRLRLLERFGLLYPLISTEAAKGPALAAMRRGGRPVAFVDDIPHNLLSVAEHVPDAALFHLMAHEGFRQLARPVPAPIRAVDGWDDAAPLIAEALGLSRA